MNLNEDLISARKRLDTLNQSEEERVLIQQQRDLERQLNTGLKKMISIWQWLETFETTILPVLDPDEYAGMSEKLESLKTDFQKNIPQQSLLIRREGDHPEINEQKLVSFQKGVSLLDKKRKELWQSYFKDQYSTIRQLLDVMKSLNPEKVLTLTNQLATAGNGALEAERSDQVREFQLYLTEANKQVTSLNLNSEVSSFLNKINNYTCTLEDLTEEVYNWLRQNGLLKTFKIRPKS